MELSTARVVEIARDGIIGLFLGLALALLALVPDWLLSQFQKLVVGIALVIISLILLGLKIFYEDLQERKELSYKIDKFKDKLPETVVFGRYDRTVRINADGDARITDDLEIENVSNKEISSISIPSKCDIYDNNDLEVLANESKHQVDMMNIGDTEIDSADDCCEKGGLLVKGDDFLEKVNIRIPFEEVGGLPPRGEAGCHKNVTFSYMADGALKEAIVSDEDGVGYEAHHPTEKVKLTVYPPEGCDVQLGEMEGVEVRDTKADVIDREEIGRVDSPQIIDEDGPKIEWEISDPKLTYVYLVHFNCQNVS